MLNFIGKTYRGKEFAEIFLKLQYNETTFSKGLVNVLDNVKGELVLNSASATPVIKAYNSRPTKSVADSVTAKQYVVSPKQRMFYEEYSPAELLKSRFENTMKPGASNLDSSEWDDLLLATIAPEMASAIAKSVWQGDSIGAVGLLSKMYADAASVKLTGAAITKTTVKQAFSDLYDAMHPVLVENGEGLIYADRGIRKFVVGANTDAQFRDIFTTANGEHYFQDVKIEYVPLGANQMFAARPKDLIVATDLMNDFSSIRTELVQANSEDKFVKMLYTMDTLCIAPENVALYDGN